MLSILNKSIASYIVFMGCFSLMRQFQESMCECSQWHVPWVVRYASYPPSNWPLHMALYWVMDRWSGILQLKWKGQDITGGIGDGHSDSIPCYIDGLAGKTAVTPLLTHWSYCSLVLSHRYIFFQEALLHQYLSRKKPVIELLKATKT